jgi:predicted regulator of Ras-like GTPase activity (Roadblock/LC7/MglB family)
MHNGGGILVPLQSILQGLPLELRPKVKVENVGNLSVSVPLDRILSQLNQGMVKIPFGDLRRAAPQVFASGSERDRVMVPLPLSEILPRLNPALITCRRVQSRVEVPEDVSSPFDPNGQGLIFSVGPTKPEPPAPAPSPARTAPARPPSPMAPHRQTITSAPTPQPPAAKPLPAPNLVPFSRTVPGNGGNGGHTKAPIPLPKPSAIPPRAPAPIAAPAPIPPPAPIPMPAPPSAFVPPAPPSAFVPPAPAPAFVPPAPPSAFVPPAPPAPKPAPAPMPSLAASPSKPLVVGLTVVAEGWPEAVRQEIVQLNLVDAKVALPTEVVEQALKQGRIAFTWKMLRAWIKPAPLPSVSAHDGTVLELPLRVVAPLFLARQAETAKPQQQISIDENIPNLFFGFPQPEGGGGASVSSPASAKPVDTNYYVWDDGAEMLRVDESAIKRGPSPGTSFIAKYATPNEVVSRAAALDGVAGALIALPDGLMVASQVPPDLNGDTLAAFLPQIFGKVSQSTKELRMGELNNLNFTVGNVPWKIFRVNAIYFAAFGRAGEVLPTAQLAALAGELDHKAR